MLLMNSVLGDKLGYRRYVSLKEVRETVSVKGAWHGWGNVLVLVCGEVGTLYRPWVRVVYKYKLEAKKN